MNEQYQMGALAGKGGSGEVYLAHRILTAHDSIKVAIKLLRDSDEMGQSAARLKDEARWLEALNHPVIPKMVDCCRLDGKLALVMEWVSGTDLGRYVGTRRLPQRAVAEIGAAVASALYAAWESAHPQTGAALRLIHRDVKPENIRIEPDGRVRLLDFGIARTTSHERYAKTSAGSIPLTLGYAAPEAFREVELTPAADVYSLGVTLFDLLHGERFAPSNMAGNIKLIKGARGFDEYREGRFGALEASPQLHRILKRMVCFGVDERMACGTVASELRRIAAELPGLSLSQWLQTQPPLLPPTGAGQLTGQLLTPEVVQLDNTVTSRGPARGTFVFDMASEEGVPPIPIGLGQSAKVVTLSPGGPPPIISAPDPNQEQPSRQPTPRWIWLLLAIISLGLVTLCSGLAAVLGVWLLSSA